MPEVFYSCVDCPEYTIKIKEGIRYGGEVGNYCELKERFFNKSFPMRDTPCLAILEQAEYECPICGDVMAIVVSGTRFCHFECKTHGKQEPCFDNKNMERKQ